MNLKTELLSQNPSYQPKILIQKCDVTSKTQLKSFAENVLKEFGHVDVLINNAGIFRGGKLYEEADGGLEDLMTINLYSAHYLSKWLVPAMIERKRGHIFNLCSVASIQAYSGGGAYSVTKFALLGLSKALRQELKEFSIKVTAIIAGATLTESWSGTEHHESRFMQARDVAAIIWDINKLSAGTVVEEILLRPILGDI